MPLLDLPPELLTLIAEQISPAELRTSVDYLLISKIWFKVALPVFLDGLDFTSTQLSAFDLERLPPSECPLSRLMQAKTIRLSTYLVGHPSKQISRKPWYSNQDSDNDEDADEEEWQGTEEDWAPLGPLMRGRCQYDWEREMNLTLIPWREKMNNKLNTLAKLLASFEDIEEFSFQASSEDRGARGPRWDYLCAPTMGKIIESLPMTVRNLTLDTCGSNLISSKESDPQLHLCPLIARHLVRFQRVRLRMRCICPQVLPSSFQNSPQLQSLVIKLSLPFFPPGSNQHHNGKDEFDAKPCGQGADQYRIKKIIKSAITFSQSLPPLYLLRISYRNPEYSGINLVLADCITQRYMHDPTEIFSYEDTGDCWDPWEENDSKLRPMVDSRGSPLMILA